MRSGSSSPAPGCRRGTETTFPSRAGIVEPVTGREGETAKSQGDISMVESMTAFLMGITLISTGIALIATCVAIAAARSSRASARKLRALRRRPVQPQPVAVETSPSQVTGPQAFAS